MFSCEFCKIFKNAFLIELLQALNQSNVNCRRTDPNGHIFVDSLLIRRRNSTWKVRRDFIDFERRIQVEIMISIRRGSFEVNLSFKIEEIWMSSPRGFFYLVSTSNRRNFFTRYLHSIIFKHFLLWEPILS